MADKTPAVQRTPERPTCPGCKTVVSYVQWSCVSPTDGTAWHLVCAGLHVESTRKAVLAAALDVEEMARAMVTAVHGDGWWNADGPTADSVRSNNRARACAARAAILGEA